jgi:pyroglutamyl-peptidase
MEYALPPEGPMPANRIGSGSPPNPNLNADAVDREMVNERDQGVSDDAEKKQLTRQLQSDHFEPGKARIQEHLNFLGSPSRVAAGVQGAKIASIEGRIAHLTTSLPGLTAEVGLFDNSLALDGTAGADGKLTFVFDGNPESVAVTKGDTAAQILAKVQAALPHGVQGHLFSSDLMPQDPAKLEGGASSATDTSAHLILWRPISDALPQGTKPLKVLVTGYGPFDGYPDNPSGDLAQAVGKLGIPGANVQVQVLPVEYGKVDDFIAQIKKDPPDIILSMGAGPREIEVKAYNENAGVADVAGNLGPGQGPIDPNGPATLNTTLPVDAINKRLANTFGSAATLESTTTPPDPGSGAYLCNYINYRLLQAFQGTNTEAGFIHISAETAPEEIQTILEAAVAEKARQAQPPQPIA